MSKKSSVEKNMKRQRLVVRYAQKRLELKKVIKNTESSVEECFKASVELAALPRNSSRTRVRHRCFVTGRPRAYLRRYGVSRIAFRDLALQGEIPGVKKSSW